MVAIGNNTFTCSICRKVKPIEYLKGSLKNDAELQRLISELDELELKKIDLRDKQLEAQIGQIDGSGILREREFLNTRIRGVINRIKNFTGLLVCVADWNAGRSKALEKKGMNIKFACAFCRREVSGKKYWCHILNGLDKDINPWIAEEICKSCWLYEIVPNDKVNYCPRLGSEGFEGYSLNQETYDCQCKVGGKMNKDREGGYRDY